MCPCPVWRSKFCHWESLLSAEWWRHLQHVHHADLFRRCCCLHLQQAISLRVCGTVHLCYPEPLHLPGDRCIWTLSGGLLEHPNLKATVCFIALSTHFIQTPIWYNDPLLHKTKDTWYWVFIVSRGLTITLTSSTRENTEAFHVLDKF